jgi:hypothetical protein
MKKIIAINSRKVVEHLNTIYNDWNKHVDLQNENSEGPNELIPILKKLKKAGTKIGNIDLSSAPDLSCLTSRKTDLMRREILSLRELKNTKIELKQYAEAVELDKKEHMARTQLNKHICEVIYKSSTCFFEIPEDKIGFVYNGNKLIDTLFESTFTKVFKEYPVFGFSVVIKNKEISGKTNEPLKNAA